MIIAVNIERPLEDALKQRAEAAGLSVEAYSRQLAEKDVQTLGSLDPRIQTSVRIVEGLRGKLGVLSDDALSSEVLHGEP